MSLDDRINVYVCVCFSSLPLPLPSLLRAALGDSPLPSSFILNATHTHNTNKGREDNEKRGIGCVEYKLNKCGVCQ